jgi:hypothetical protein
LSELESVAVAVKLKVLPALVGVDVAEGVDSCASTVQLGGVLSTVTAVETAVACANGTWSSKNAPKLVTVTSAIESIAARVILPPLLVRKKDVRNERAFFGIV